MRGEIVEDEAGVADETTNLGEETEILGGSFRSSSVWVSILLNIIESCVWVSAFFFITKGEDSFSSASFSLLCKINTCMFL